MTLHQDTTRAINIAIDGPAGAGKSTVARQVAEKLGYIYVDTGAMYRAVTYIALKAGTALDDEPAVAALVDSLHIELQPGHEGQRVAVNGTDVTDKLRSQQVSANVSQVAQYEQVRRRLVTLQKQMARSKGVVMDGRDIGTQVLPDAELKVFLTASVQIRAMRRFKELADSESLTLSQLEGQITERDRKDEQRPISPLKRADDAYLLDSSTMSIPEVVEHIIDLCKSKLGGENP